MLILGWTRSEENPVEFEIGDKAVYPAHGVGLIQDIETMEFEGEELTFYLLKILDNAMSIKVPVQNAEAIGMRSIIPAAEVEGVYEILRDRETPPDNQTWNRRYREYMNKIKTGDPIEVAKVLRDLAIMKMEKNLSFGEQAQAVLRNLILVEASIPEPWERVAVFARSGARARRRGGARGRDARAVGASSPGAGAPRKEIERLTDRTVCACVSCS